MSDERWGFQDLPASAFPFTVEWFVNADEAGARPVHTATVDGPGALTVPKLGPCWARVRYADGEEVDSRD